MNEPSEKAGLRGAWSRVADVYEGMRVARTAHITAEGLDMLAPPAGAHGVDVTCGPGVTTVALSERLRGRTALGVDFSPAMVERAAARDGDRPGVAARTLRPGGRLLQVVRGRAANVGFAPVIEPVETRANHFSAARPMMFFCGPPGVMQRMVGEAGLAAEEVPTSDHRMSVEDVEEACLAVASRPAP